MIRMTREKPMTTRRRLSAMAASEKETVAGYHFWFPSMGYVEDDTNHRLRPVRCSPLA